jgi:hypothetical protein
MNRIESGSSVEIIDPIPTIEHIIAGLAFQPIVS